MEQKVQGIESKLVGLVLQGRGVLRPGQRILTDAGDGMTTSGSFSPTLKKAIAFARIPKNAVQSCQVEIRGKLLDCSIVRPPFARNGTVCEGII
jgi:aminomethyltransferase